MLQKTTRIAQTDVQDPHRWGLGEATIAEVVGGGGMVSSVFQDQDMRYERDGLDLLAGPVDHGHSQIQSVLFAQGGGFR